MNKASACAVRIFVVSVTVMYRCCYAISRISRVLLDMGCYTFKSWKRGTLVLSRVCAIIWPRWGRTWVKKRATDKHSAGFIGKARFARCQDFVATSKDQRWYSRNLQEYCYGIIQIETDTEKQIEPIHECSNHGGWMDVAIHSLAHVL